MLKLLPSFAIGQDLNDRGSVTANSFTQVVIDLLTANLSSQ